MSKRIDQARDRLHTAALELFRERGYDGTTAAEIAARAGVTERTFFRHFPDKREVLFDGEAMVRTQLIGFIAAAPAGLSELDTLFQAFRSFLPTLERSLSYSKPRHDIISVTPVLREREIAKIETLVDAIANALTGRGVPALRAALAARTGMAAFAHATHAWLDDPGADLGHHVDAAFRELRAILTHES